MAESKFEFVRTAVMDVSEGRHQPDTVMSSPRSHQSNFTYCHVVVCDIIMSEL